MSWLFHLKVTVINTLVKCLQKLARALLICQTLIYVQSCLLDAGIEMAGFYQTAFLKYMIYQRHWSEIILVLLS